jgi:hypothetical protein
MIEPWFRVNGETTSARTALYQAGLRALYYFSESAGPFVGLRGPRRLTLRARA